MYDNEKASQNKNISQEKFIKTIYSQMKYSVCRIKCTEESYGTGFFSIIPDYVCKEFTMKINTNLTALVTTTDIITRDDINNEKNIELTLDNGKNKINVKIDKDRAFVVEKYEISIIEIKENKKLKKNFFIKVDEELFQSKYPAKFFMEKPVYLLYYPNEKIKKNDGLIIFIDGKEKDFFSFQYLCESSPGSIGGPIISSEDYKLIGIHTGSSKKEENLSFGVFFNICSYYIVNKKQKEKNLNNKNNESNKTNIITPKNKKIENIQDEIKILFQLKDNFQTDVVQILGIPFVKNNENLKIICQKDEYELEYKICSHININNVNMLDNNRFYIKLKGISKITDISFMFSDCTELSYIGDMSDFNTINVTNMKKMFYNCVSLEYLPNISKLDTSNVTSMEGLFFNCQSLKSAGKITDWKPKSLMFMDSMFCGCKSLQVIPDISGWDTKNVINMQFLFSECDLIPILPDISQWNTENVQYIDGMFSECPSLKYFPDISGWNTKNLISMNSLFSGCLIEKIPDISDWNTENVKDMGLLFSGCKLLKSLPDISKWNTENVKIMNGMFYECKYLSSLPDISLWDTKNVISMNQMFYSCFLLNRLPEISKWNTEQVSDMGGIFNGCISLKTMPDISKWNTQNVDDMSLMFRNCFNLKNLPDISKWKVKRIANTEDMFSGIKNLKIPTKFLKKK